MLSDGRSHATVSFPLISEPAELLGELQLAFVCFLVCQVYDAFEHWKQLVHLLCSCDAALGQHQQFYLDFLSMSARDQRRCSVSL